MKVGVLFFLLLLEYLWFYKMNLYYLYSKKKFKHVKVIIEIDVHVNLEDIK